MEERKKPSDIVRKGEDILRTLHHIEEMIMKAMVSRPELDLTGISRSVRNLEAKVQSMLETSEDIKRISEILSNKHYFPKVNDIVDYIRKTYSISIPVSRSKQVVVWKAAKVIADHQGLDMLEMDLQTLRRLRKGREKIPKVNVYRMEINEIEREFNNITKYPDVESIKLAVKDSIPSRKISKIRTREGIIKAITDHVGRLRSAEVFGKKEIFEKSS